jgi:hypothetical protein
MATITGRYEFHDECPPLDLEILAVSPQGDLVNSSIDGNAIQGHYDAATDAIRLTWELIPQVAPFDTFVYDGYALIENGVVCALAGTYYGIVLTGRPLSVKYFRGGWYATYQGPVIG